MFKPDSPAASGRKVSFQNGPPEEIDDLHSEPSKPPQQQGRSGKSSKWQPLSAVEPSPVAENDPFSLGDSDDDKETKAKKNQFDETERVQTTTGEAIAGSTGGDSETLPGISQGSGTKT